MSRRTFVVATAVLGVVLAGCGTRGAESGTDGATPTATPTAPVVTEMPTPAPPPTPRASPGTCAGQPTRLTAGFVEAATGHRYLPLVIENCSRQPIPLTDPPPIRAVLPSGEELRTRFVPKPGVPRPTVQLAPGQRAYLGLEWLAAARIPRWAETLRISSPSLGDHTLTYDLLDINRRTRTVEVYAWTTRRDRIWDY